MLPSSGKGGTNSDEFFLSTDGICAAGGLLARASIIESVRGRGIDVERLLLLAAFGDQNVPP